MELPKTVTKVFCDGDVMPLEIDVPMKVPIKNFETENAKVTNCYTTGKSVRYRLRQIRYGLEHVVFADYQA